MTVLERSCKVIFSVSEQQKLPFDLPFLTCVKVSPYEFFLIINETQMQLGKNVEKNGYV